MTLSPLTTELAYLVAGMSCDHCRVAIAGEVSRLRGYDAVAA